jgi:hypothetical protein
VIKDEAPYLEEWIEYHLLVGVQKFFIINNDSDDGPEEVLAPYIAAGIVDFSSVPGRGNQTAIYNMWLPVMRKVTFWVAVIDVDEYLVPLASRSVAEILRGFEAFVGIMINWVVYGWNGILRKEPGLVIERFKRHTNWNHPQNRYTKSISNPRRTWSLGIHDALYMGNNLSVNSLGQPNRIWYMHREPVHEVLRINHYFSKSKEEFVKKRTRGRASVPDPEDTENKLRDVEFDLAVRGDDISGDDVIDWIIPIVKQQLENRRREHRERLQISEAGGSGEMSETVSSANVSWVSE